MPDLNEVAKQAQIDAKRANDLRAAIQIIGDHQSGALVTFTTDFVGTRDTYLADAEVDRTLKQMWPTIWEQTMRASAEELKQIQAKYAELMSETGAEAKGNNHV